jgi:hypothetical protein
MPASAGVVDATPTRRIAHFSYIDTNGQPRTDSYDIPAAATDAEINAMVTALGAATNADLWQVGFTNWFATGQPSKSNAIEAVDDSVKDNIVVLYKNVANDSKDFFIPAPKEALLVAGTLNPDPTPAGLLDNVIQAADALFGTYEPVSVRYSERAKKNKAVKL